MASVVPPFVQSYHEKPFDATKLRSIKQLAELADLKSIPSCYTYNTNPGHENANSDSQDAIPTIDFSLLTSGDTDQRSKVVQDLGKACEEWGFFMFLKLKMANTEGVVANLPVGPNVGANETVNPLNTGNQGNPMIPVIPVNVPNVPAGKWKKSEKFSGKDFKRWQQKMLFYLTTLKLTWFLDENVPILSEDEQDAQSVLAVEAWKHADFLYRNYSLNGLDNAIYGVYSLKITSKELWDSLDKKYKTEDAGTKKFLASRFLEYKMVDAKSVIHQAEELQIIYSELTVEGLVTNESFQTACLIDKVPPGWKYFKNYLKHKRKEMSMEERITRLRIEEDSRKTDKKPGDGIYAKAKVVEGNSKRKRDNGSFSKFGENKRFKCVCFVCNKEGHMARNCSGKRISNGFKGKKNKKYPQANMAKAKSICKSIEDLKLFHLGSN